MIRPVRAARLALVVLGLTLAGGRAWAEERSVMLFRPAAGGFALDDARLTDAVRIYTRSVGSSAGARLTMWYEGRVEEGSEVSVTLYVLPSGQEASGPAIVQLRGRRDDNLYRALALKVRAVLAGDPTVERVAAPPTRLVPSPVTPAAPPVADASPPTTDAKAPTPAPPEPPATPPATTPPSDVGGLVAPGPRAWRFRLDAEAAFHVVLSDGTSAARWGGAFTLALPVTRFLAVTAGFAADSPHVAGATSATMSIWPVHAGLRFMLQRNKFELGLGVRGGAAIFRPEASVVVPPDVATATELRAAGLAGAEVAARLRLHPNIALAAGATADVLLKRWQFTALNSPVLDGGRILVGLGLGVVATIP